MKDMEKGPGVASVRVAYFVPDSLPTFRPDVDYLFNQALAGEGVDTLLIGDRSIQRSSSIDEMQEQEIGRNSEKRASVFGRILFFLRALRTCTSERFDIVQVRDMPVLGAIVALACRLRGQRFFYWVSFPIPEMEMLRARDRSEPMSPAKRALLFLRGGVAVTLQRLITLRSADYVFTQSRQMERDLSPYGLPLDRTRPVPMCVAPGSIGTASLAARRDRFLMGYLGSCDRQRRVDILFEVLENVRRTGIPAQLLVIGDASNAADREWLRRRAEASKVAEHITITGWLPRAKAESCMGDVGVAFALMAPHPMLNSTSPTKLVEYLAAGIPVVANDHPEQTEIIELSGAGERATFDADSLSAAAVRIMADLSALERCEIAGKHFVAIHRNYDLLARELGEIYRLAAKAG